MTRSEPRWGCEFCRAQRVTREGIESHVRHKHPADYQRAIKYGVAVSRHIN